MKTKVLGVVLVVAVAVSGCVAGPRAVGGGAGGAVVGGLIGAAAGNGHPLAIAAGTIAGLLTGAAIGDALDNQDRQLAAEATQAAFTHGVPYRRYRWYNPRTIRSGYVMTQPPAYTATGQYCREYQHTVLVAGREQTAYGRACQQPDGSWQVQG